MSAICIAITPFRVKRLIDVPVVQVVHKRDEVLPVFEDIETEAQSAVIARGTAPEMSAMMSSHLCRLLSIQCRNSYDFAPEQTAIEELRGENEPPFLNSDGEVRELYGESVSNIDSVIARESLCFDDVVLSVADIYRVFMRDFTHSASPVRSVRSNRQWLLTLKGSSCSHCHRKSISRDMMSDDCSTRYSLLLERREQSRRACKV